MNEFVTDWLVAVYNDDNMYSDIEKEFNKLVNILKELKKLTEKEFAG